MISRFRTRGVLVAELQGVSKTFGRVQALEAFDLQLQAGEILALLGPNGAGKTTALSLLLGLRRPDRGTAQLFGKDPREPSHRAAVGVTPQETAFPENLKAREILDLVRAHYAEPLPRSELLERFGLAEQSERQVGGLSGGQRRRLAAALAFAGRPKAVFLDEPTTGLDVEARHGLWRVIRRHAKDGGTVLLTTHYLEEAEGLADRIVLVNHGRVVRSGSVEEIRAVIAVRVIRFRAPAAPALPGVIRRESEGDRHSLYCRDADEAVRALVASGVAFQDLEVLPARFEDAVRAALDGKT